MGEEKNIVIPSEQGPKLTPLENAVGEILDEYENTHTGGSISNNDIYKQLKGLDKFEDLTKKETRRARITLHQKLGIKAGR